VPDLYGHVIGYRRLAIAQPGSIGQNHARNCAVVAGLSTYDEEAMQRALGQYFDRVYLSTRSALRGSEEKV
jgi:hypothetical protein